MLAKLKRVNWVSFASMLALIALGTLAIWSAGQARGGVFATKWVETLQTAIFGLVVYGVLASVDYRRLFDWVSVPSYVGALVLLVAVLIFGDEIYGGKRWLWFFQPSEISKLCIIMFLAQLFGHAALPAWLRGLRGLLLAGALFGVPALLILMEPDLGTTLTLVPAVLVMLFAAGVWRRGLLILLAVGGILAASILCAVYEAERPGVTAERREQILKYVPLKPHQVRRVKTFLYPEEDRMGAGYNAHQAKIAIGSGGLTGRGLGKGETSRLKYLPPSVSMNDFIFCVYAEETGFVGSLLLLALYAALCVAGAWTASRAVDGRGRLFALGFTTLVFAHVYINIGMSIGLVPITGLPLPFISHGRTFLVTAMAGFGIIQSISINREEIT